MNIKYYEGSVGHLIIKNHMLLFWILWYLSSFPLIFNKLGAQFYICNLVFFKWHKFQMPQKQAWASGQCDALAELKDMGSFCDRRYRAEVSGRLPGQRSSPVGGVRARQAGVEAGPWYFQQANTGVLNRAGGNQSEHPVCNPSFLWAVLLGLRLGLFGPCWLIVFLAGASESHTLGFRLQDALSISEWAVRGRSVTRGSPLNPPCWVNPEATILHTQLYYRKGCKRPSIVHGQWLATLLWLWTLPVIVNPLKYSKKCWGKNYGLVAY